MQGPVVICSIIPTNSGKTPLYTSKNSSAVGFYKVNISIDDISNPSSRMISMIFPAAPDETACGLMIQQVQLLKKAVGLIAPLKKKSVSLLTLGPESLPWTAFLVPSVPNIALNEEGTFCLATRVLVGPMTYLHFSIAFSETISMPVTTSLVMKLIKSP